MTQRPSAHTLAHAVSAAKLRAVDVCEAALQRVAEADEMLGAFISTTPEHAREQARRVDHLVGAGQNPGPLAGVPIAIKDNICTSFGRTTCGCRMLRDYRSPYNAAVVERLLAAGAVIVGKTNLDEFAMGSSTENSALQTTRNPWDKQRVPGGSSGGSAVAVAAEMTPVALGSDTGGSIRQPAAFCGVVGIKPTYGRVSRRGLVAYGSSLDQIGPLAQNVTDAALVLQAISGLDPLDSTSTSRPPGDYVDALDDARLDALQRRLRIGVPREYFDDGLDPEIRSAVEAAVVAYRRAGARIIDVSLPHSAYNIAAYYIVAAAECSSNLARFDGVHYGRRADDAGELHDLYCRSRSEGLGAETKRRIMLGAFALSAGYYDAYYDKAMRVRRLIQQDYERAFAEVDVLIGPTAPAPAFHIGEKTADPLQMYLSDVYTVAANLAGIPAMSIPCGLTSQGLPVGLQLQGPAFGETRLLQAARIFERRVNWRAE